MRELLSKHISQDDVGRIKSTLAREPYPELLIGAVDVLRTRPYKQGAENETENATNFKVFRGSREADRLVDAMLASSAIPTLMRAVAMDGTAYWDGLFSQNPPIYELPDVHSDADGTGLGHQFDPNEIWIVRINPTVLTSEPRSLEDIRDRRNELSGNISLMQEVRAVLRMNDLQPIECQDAKRRAYERINVRFIEMSAAVARRLDYASKLDRRKEAIEKLMAHGRQRAAAFIDSLDAQIPASLDVASAGR